MRSCVSLLWVCILGVLGIGCAASSTSPPPDEAQGVAEVRAEPGSLVASDITRMSVEADGVAQDLAFNPATGTFAGSVFLTVGPHVVTGRAFSGDALVGQSQPVPVQITTGAVTRVELRILDLTGGAPAVYGPIFDSLTYPTSILLQQNAVFAISIFAPGGDPVSYAWTSDCADSAFSAPGEATTGWTRSATGSCSVTVTATSNGFSLARSFVVVVFPPGTGDGAADVSAVFVAAPQISVNFFELGCGATPSGNASCPNTTAAPTVTRISAGVFNWGGSSPGTLELLDDCGGAFGVEARSPDGVNAFWLPPVPGGRCILTVRATSAEGVVGKQTVALVVRAGTAPPIPEPPRPVATTELCFLSEFGPPAECGTFSPGATQTLSGGVFLNSGGHPGSVTFTDSCVGTVPLQAQFYTSFSATWTVPSVPPGTTCTITVHATKLEGSSGDVVGVYHVQ